LRAAVAETGDSSELRGREPLGKRGHKGEQREPFRVMILRTEPRARKTRPITDVASTALGKEEMMVRL
jgi:hypothetical protein